MKIKLLLGILLLSNLLLAQNATTLEVPSSKTVMITTLPADAEIFMIENNAPERSVGRGQYQAKIDRERAKNPVFIFRKEGFQDVRKIYRRAEKGGVETDRVELSTRIVKINVSPSDAKIFSNGIEIGTSPQSIVIPKNQTLTVEIKKPGYQSLSKVFSNVDGQEMPPVVHLFKLEDRLISLKTNPNDAILYVDDKKVGEGAASVIIKKDGCITVKVEHLGYVSTMTTYCNKDNEPVPPMAEELKLKDRVIQINTSPEDAKIVVDSREIAKGTYTLKIPEGKCTQVSIERTGYAQEKYVLCNKLDYQLESVLLVKMDEDEAYTQSEESSIANKNFSVEINPAIAPLDAWKKLTSIIQSYFDEIESIDGTTGYLRTNWTSSPMLNKNKSISKLIRTRVVITNAGSAPLKYNLKIQSELSKSESGCVNADQKTPPLNRDDCFESFPRILRKYNDLISEVQRRLQ